MSVLFIDGFDKYGGNGTALLIGSEGGTLAPVAVGDWTSAFGFGTIDIAAGLSSTGHSVALSEGSLSTMTLYKNLTTTYPRLIGGFRFNFNLIGQCGITLMRLTNQQCSIYVNSVGAVVFCTGGIGGTFIQSAGAINQGTTHYLEYDITIGASAPYAIYLDGAEIMSGTGNTRNDGVNNNADGFQLAASEEDCVMIYDDLYLFDTTGTTNNAVLLTSPRIETTFPINNVQAQFTPSTGTNWQTQANPPSGEYNYSSTVGNEDLFGFPALSVTPAAIYTVAVKGYAEKTDTGSRTISLHVKSGSNDSTGSKPSQALATTYQWIDSYFDTDPNTASNWTTTGLNAASSGYSVAS